MRANKVPQTVSNYRFALLAGLLLTLAATPLRAQVFECTDILTRDDIDNALVTESSTYFRDIPVRLRLAADSEAVENLNCDIYRAARGMNGALCLSFDNTTRADLTATVQTPKGSYGDNAVDRMLRLPMDSAEGTISCELANQLFMEVSAPPFTPVETDPSNGQVCLRDVMRAPGIPSVQNAIIRDSAGAEFSTGSLVNDGSNCFSLDDTYAAGVFEVISFEVDTFDAASVELGRVASLVQPEMLDSQHSGVWFIKVGDTGSGIGSLDNPFNSTTSFNMAQGRTDGPQPGDFIYVVQADPDEFSAQLKLLDNQWLVGRGEGLLDALAAYGAMPPADSPLNDSVYVDASDRSGISSFEQSPIVLARNNTLAGISLDTAFAPALIGDDLGSLTVRNTTISASNGGIAVLSNMAIDIELDNVFAGGGFTVNALDLKNTTGRLSIEGGLLAAVARNDEADLGRAISLVNAENISIDDVQLDGSTFGIYGRDVVNFSLTNSTVDTGFVSTEIPASGIDFENLTGDVVFNNVRIATGSDSNLRIHNSAGSLNARLQGLDLGGSENDSQTSVKIESFDQALVSVILSNSMLRGALNHAVECTVEGAATLNCLLVENQIFQTQNELFGDRYSSQPLIFKSVSNDESIPGNFTMNYGVIGNPGDKTSINDSLRGAIAANFTQGSGTANGVITDLRFGTDGDPNSGARFGNAIEITTAAEVTHNLSLTNTQMFGAFNDGALRILGAGPTSTTIRNLQFFGEDADLLVQLSDRSSDTLESESIHCIDIADSTLVTWDSARYFALSQRSSIPGRIRLPDYQGSANGEDSAAAGTASADLTAYLALRNVNLVSFNPDIDPVVFASNVVGIEGGAETCAPASPLL